MAPLGTVQKIMENNTDPEAAETAQTTDSPAVDPSTACYASSAREPRPHLAARHRLAALAMSWRSSALWKMHDAEMADDENEAIACRREAQSFEMCASNVEAWLRNFA